MKGRRDPSLALGMTGRGLTGSPKQKVIPSNARNPSDLTPKSTSDDNESPGDPSLALGMTCWAPNGTPNDKHCHSESFGGAQDRLGVESLRSHPEEHVG